MKAYCAYCNRELSADEFAANQRLPPGTLFACSAHVQEQRSALMQRWQKLNEEEKNWEKDPSQPGYSCPISGKRIYLFRTRLPNGELRTGAVDCPACGGTHYLDKNNQIQASPIKGND